MYSVTRTQWISGYYTVCTWSLDPFIYMLTNYIKWGKTSCAYSIVTRNSLRTCDGIQDILSIYFIDLKCLKQINLQISLHSLHVHSYFWVTIEYKYHALFGLQKCDFKYKHEQHSDTNTNIRLQIYLLWGYSDHDPPLL